MDNESNPLSAEIKALCLRLLARREHSQHELLNKLQLKGYNKTDCWPVIVSLTQQNWQNDHRYAENYARSCLQRGYGPLFIKYNLQQQGVSDIDLDSIAKATVGSWAEQLEQVYTKKYGHKPVTDTNEKAKRSRFLLHRGFSHALVNRLLENKNNNDSDG